MSSSLVWVGGHVCPHALAPPLTLYLSQHSPSLPRPTWDSRVQELGSSGRLNFFWEPMAAGKGGAENMAATTLMRVIHECICSEFLGRKAKCWHCVLSPSRHTKALLCRATQCSQPAPALIQQCTASGPLVQRGQELGSAQEQRQLLSLLERARMWNLVHPTHYHQQ